MHSWLDLEWDHCDLSVSYRALKQPTRQRVALNQETSGARKLANRARHQRTARRKAPSNGAHRRRVKRAPF